MRHRAIIFLNRVDGDAIEGRSYGGLNLGKLFQHQASELVSLLIVQIHPDHYFVCVAYAPINASSLAVKEGNCIHVHRIFNSIYWIRPFDLLVLTMTCFISIQGLVKNIFYGGGATCMTPAPNL